MAVIARSRVSIRFFGESLDPAEVTRLLGVEPTTHYRKGDERKSRGGPAQTRRYGAWIIATEDYSPEAIDAQLEGLFNRLSQDLTIWSDLTARFDADVFCGLFMEESNEGFSLLPVTLRALADRNLEVGFDIYDPVEEPNGASLPQSEA